ncbi:MAG: hypothetical protein KGZ89_00285 [Actinobacteria bacterium]|nr:hypothetical protein [Actinomycetota bacterium]
MSSDSQLIESRIIHVDCDHDPFALIIGQEVLKLLNSVPKKDTLKTKILVTFDGQIKTQIVE